jgi:uncharacterized protein RhaS with RHS repeats
VDDPLGRRHTWLYDPRGLLDTYQNARGQVTIYTYTARQEEETRRHLDGTRVTTQYDRLGLADWIAEPQGRWTFGYDYEGRRNYENGPGFPLGHPLTSEYDPNGNRTLLWSAWGRLTYAYDEGDLL